LSAFYTLPSGPKKAVFQAFLKEYFEHEKARPLGQAFLANTASGLQRVGGRERVELLIRYLPTGLKLMAAPPPGASFRVRADLLVTTCLAIW